MEKRVHKQQMLHQQYIIEDQIGTEMNKQTPDREIDIYLVLFTHACI